LILTKVRFWFFWYMSKRKIIVCTTKKIKKISVDSSFLYNCLTGNLDMFRVYSSFLTKLEVHDLQN
jgi:hypothetical protein